MWWQLRFYRDLLAASVPNVYKMLARRQSIFHQIYYFFHDGDGLHSKRYCSGPVSMSPVGSSQIAISLPLKPIKMWPYFTGNSPVRLLRIVDG